MEGRGGVVVVGGGVPVVRSCVLANVKELTCRREHLLAGDEETEGRKRMGTEWEKMGGQCGETGRELWRAARGGGTGGGRETVMVVDRLEFTTGSW